MEMKEEGYSKNKSSNNYGLSNIKMENFDDEAQLGQN